MINFLTTLFIYLVVIPYYFIKGLGCDHIFVRSPKHETDIYECEKCTKIMVLIDLKDRK